MSAKVPATKRVSSKIRKYCAMPFLTVIPMSYFTRISVLGDTQETLQRGLLLATHVIYQLKLTVSQNSWLMANLGDNLCNKQDG